VLRPPGSRRKSSQVNGRPEDGELRTAIFIFSSHQHPRCGGSGMHDG
jgi:hypothetical protein